jgi:hypothetical protein
MPKTSLLPFAVLPVACGMWGATTPSTSLHFEPNRGQFAVTGKFIAAGRGFGVAIGGDAITLATQSGQAKLTFQGANRGAELDGEHPQPGVSNYFLGNRPDAWIREVPNYQSVRYREIYTGIDAIFYSRQQKELEFDLVVAAGANPSQVRFQARSASLDPSGALALPGGLHLNRPTIYQNAAGERKPVAGSFVQLGSNEFGFRIGAYDHTRPLVIDPAIPMLYSTLLGGDHDDEATGIALDSAGNSYIVGYSASNIFIVTSNAVQPGNGRLPGNTGGQVTNAVVAKFSPSGTLLYSTYLGGNDADNGQAITVDASGNAYIYGLASSPNFPITANAYQSTISGEEAFLSVLSPDGSALEYSSFFGTGDMPFLSFHGSMIGGGAGIALDATGRVYVTGTSYAGMPTSQTAYMAGLPNNYLGFAGYIALFDLKQLPAYQLVASTYFTAPRPAQNTRYFGSYSYTVTLDSQGNPWIAGEDLTGALPTTGNAYQSSVTVTGGDACAAGGPLGSAAYLAEFTPDLSTLQYASYLSGRTVYSGGAGFGECGEWIQGLTADGAGNLYAAGVTASGTFPVTAGSLQSTYPGPSAATGPQPVSFVAKLTTGKSIGWASYLGQDGGATEIFSQPFLDSSGNVWVAGEATTPGYNFPLSANALTGQGGNQTAFLTGISSDGTTAVFSSYLSGSVYPTLASGVALDSYGNIYIAGTTCATNFPTTTGAIQTVLNLGLTNGSGFADLFFTILGGGSLYVASPPAAGNAGSVTLTLNGSGFQQGATCTLSLNGQTYTSASSGIATDGTVMTCVIDLTGAAPGKYTLTVNNPGGSTITLPATFAVETASGPHIWSEIVGRPIIRVAQPSNFYVTYGNSGDTDAYFSTLWMAFPATYSYTLAGTQSPPEADGTTLDYTGYPNGITVDGMTYVPLLLPYVPAGWSGAIQLQLTVPEAVSPIGVTAYMEPPWFSSLASAQQAFAAAAADSANLPVCTPLASNPVVSNCMGSFLGFMASVLAGTANLQGVPVGPIDMEKWKQQIAAGMGIMVQPNQLPAVTPPTQNPNPNPPGQNTNPGGGNKGNNGTPPGPAAVPAARTAKPQQYSGNSGTRNWNLQIQILVQAMQQLSLAIDFLEQSLYLDYLFDLDPCLVHIYQTLGISTAPPDLFWALIDGLDQAFPTYESRVKLYYCYCNGTEAGQSYDPNFKTGPAGDASANRYIGGGVPVRYDVGFENQATATLPAQQVVVTDQLDGSKVDLSTFSPLAAAFGSQFIPLSSNSPTTDLVVSLNTTLSVRIQGGVNPATGLVRFTFTSIDPTTYAPPTDPTVGFLPPDTDGIVGQGSVLFTVMPKAGLTTGTTFTNQATVVFDANAPIATPVWTNTLDVNLPVSHVQVLPSQESQASFTVNWSGTDVGAGITHYAIFVSDNGSPYSVWLNAPSTTTSATYPGQSGHSYSFYSIAVDGAGNSETPKTAAEASTTDTAPNPCDVQNIGSVTVVDVQSMISQALGAASPSNDLNGNGVVNVVDVQIVLNAALGMACSGS